jgi:Fic family protein
VKTLRFLSDKPASIPAATAWYLADLAEARARHALLARQSPRKLETLREHAMIQSALSSNRIEGVEVQRARIHAVLQSRARLLDRNEEEVRGYRDALALIHERNLKLPISERTILRLHSMVRAGAGDAGAYKRRDSDIIERSPDGRTRVRFRTVPASRTPAAVRETIDQWSLRLEERWTHPLIALAAFNLDFLCIHPFRDGNGRVSRLLMRLQSHHLGHLVGRLVSLERLIEENKDRYYETLELGSRGWHDGRHDAWPYINFVLFILKSAYRELEASLARIAEPRGAKTEIVLAAIGRTPGGFRIADVRRECPGVSVDLIRRVLKRLRAEGKIECTARGRDAAWRKTRRWGSGRTWLTGYWNGQQGRPPERR